MPYNRQSTDKQLIQAWVPRALAVAIDVESTKRASETGTSPRSAKATLIREALIKYLIGRGKELADIT